MRAAFIAFTLLASTLLRAVEAPAVINDWIAAQQHMGDIKVGFKMIRTLPTMKDPISNDGQFWRLADGRFRWELGSPAITILMFDNTDLHLWDGNEKKWQTLSPNEGRMRMWMHFLNSKDLNAEEMTKNFIPTVTSETADLITIALQPKGLMVRKHLKQVDLQIDPATKHLRQIRMIQADDSTMLMAFARPETVSAADKSNLQLTPKL
jgi:outer membrane lipoprotein-sorting protein